MAKYFLTGFAVLFITVLSLAQHVLKPGFDGNEYRSLLRLAFNIPDSVAVKMGIKQPNIFSMVYASPEYGLYNQWNLWVNDRNKIAVINIRGTIGRKESWLENFYAAMIPAIGSLTLNDSTIFNYKMANDSAATVHVGWMLGLAHLAPDIIKHIKEYYDNGFKDFIICGHSQGGVLSFLLRSYLEYNGDLPKDIQYKTYCSGAPKPGNLYYAYDFDFITKNNWAFRVVNSLDWVPEAPFSIQTLDDFNKLNGLTALKPFIKKQKLFLRWYLNGAHNKIDKSTAKAAGKMKKYLGYTLYEMVKEKLPQFKEPKYSYSNNYMTAGVPIVLQPDAEYKYLFPDNGKNPFLHHMVKPYYYLSEVWYP